MTKYGVHLEDEQNYQLLVDQMRPGQDWVWCTDLPDRYFPKGFRKSETPYGEMFVMGPFATERAANANAERFLKDGLGAKPAITS